MVTWMPESHPPTQPVCRSRYETLMALCLRQKLLSALGSTSDGGSSGSVHETPGVVPAFACPVFLFTTAFPLEFPSHGPPPPMPPAANRAPPEAMALQALRAAWAVDATRPGISSGDRSANYHSEAAWYNLCSAAPSVLAKAFLFIAKTHRCI